MTTRETRREEYSTNIVRTLSPATRPMSPYSNKTELDNNLDHLLDDLQSSISRPGSAMGQPVSHYTTHREVQYLNPVNTTTIMRERSLSPNTSVSTSGTRNYKTTKYEYSSTLDGGRTSSTGYHSDSGNISEINKLDSLLSDLEQERDATLDRNKSSVSNIGIDSGLLEPGTKVIKTTTTYTTKNPVQRELVFDSPEISTLRNSRHRSPGYERIIETTTTKHNSSNNDVHYGGTHKLPQRTLSPTTNRNDRYYTETRTVNNINNEIIPAPVPQNVNYNEVVRVENSTGPPVALQEVQLSDDILPKPKTKVTTTVRTYTYEIPEPDTTTQTVVYKNEYNTNNSITQYPDRDPPKNNAVFYKTERTSKGVNYYPNQNQPQEPQRPLGFLPSPQPLAIQEPPQNSTTTTVYKYDITNTNNQPPSNNIPPGGITIYPPPPQQTTVIYKTDTQTVNQKYRTPTPTNYYPVNNGPSHDGPYYPHGHPQHGNPPYNQNQPSHPADPSVIVYKHTTTTNTRNIISPRQEREPLLPFPVDGPIITEVDGNPPKHLHDLMATFGDTVEPNYQSKKVQIAEKPFERVNEKNLALASKSKDTVDDKDKSHPSKNIAGPPVYYPPNHELFLKKEEGASAYRAQGGYARASGKYKYESESKSKSSSKSGAAVVPVCLPLCCAMPCTIM